MFWYFLEWSIPMLYNDMRGSRSITSLPPQYVGSRDFQNFSDALLTKFSYPWCSVERALRARELRYDLNGLKLCTIYLPTSNETCRV